MRDSNADLNVLTSTGLTVDDIAASLEIIPNGYKLIHHTRTKRKGGGITLLHTDCHSITVLNIKCVEESSFEISELSVKPESFSMKLVIIYRPPYSTSHPCSHAYDFHYGVYCVPGNNYSVCTAVNDYCCF